MNLQGTKKIKVKVNKDSASFVKNISGIVKISNINYNDVITGERVRRYEIIQN